MPYVVQACQSGVMSGTTLMGVAAPLLQQVIIEGERCGGPARHFPLNNVVIHGLVSFSPLQHYCSSSRKSDSLMISLSTTVLPDESLIH